MPAVPQDPATGRMPGTGSVSAMLLRADDQRLGLDLNLLGARPADIGQTGKETWHVLADPEGNELCLLEARLAPL